MTKAKRGPKKKVETNKLREITVVATPMETANWHRNVTITSTIPIDIHYDLTNGRDLNIQLGGKRPIGWDSAGSVPIGGEVRLTMKGQMIF